MNYGVQNQRLRIEHDDQHVYVPSDRLNAVGARSTAENVSKVFTFNPNALKLKEALSTSVIRQY